MQRPARDKPAPSWSVPRQFRRPLTDLGCTCGGPAITSLDGTDDGEQSKKTSDLRSHDLCRSKIGF